MKIPFGPRTRKILASIALVITGAAIGAAAALSLRPPLVMAPVVVKPIASLSGDAAPWSPEAIATVRGKVAEIYGGNFVLQDGSGKILVQAGHRGQADAVTLNQTMMVQGRVHSGVMRASYLVDSAGKVVAVGRHGHHHGRYHARPHPEQEGPDTPRAAARR